MMQCFSHFFGYLYKCHCLSFDVCVASGGVILHAGACLYSKNIEPNECVYTSFSLSCVKILKENLFFFWLFFFKLSPIMPQLHVKE